MRSVLLIALSLLSACGDDSPCGVSWDGEAPALGTMVLSDGTVLPSGTWSGSRINAGTLTIEVRFMDDEPVLADLVAAGETPVCRSLDDQNDAVSYQFGGSPWITDGSHEGTLAITAIDGEQIEGRFQATLRNASDNSSKTISGAFLLPKAP